MVKKILVCVAVLGASFGANARSESASPPTFAGRLIEITIERSSSGGRTCVVRTDRGIYTTWRTLSGMYGDQVFIRHYNNRDLLGNWRTDEVCIVHQDQRESCGRILW